MTQEGVSRSVFPMNGERHDLEVWALLADEWAGGEQFGQGGRTPPMR